MRGKDIRSSPTNVAFQTRGINHPTAGQRHARKNPTELGVFSALLFSGWRLSSRNAGVRGQIPTLVKAQKDRNPVAGSTCLASRREANVARTDACSPVIDWASPGSLTPPETLEK